METKIILGVVLCAVAVFFIGELIKKLSDGNKPKEIEVNPVGTYRKESASATYSKAYGGKPDTQRFGRFKVTSGDGTKRTLVGNLATILEVNNVESFYEIK
jgi:hypothetical protein